MRVKVERMCLGLLAVVFTVVGAIALLAPRVLFDPTGLALDSLAGLAEIRAAYAGLFGAAAYVFARGAHNSAHRSHGLTVAVIVLGGFVLGRLLSWAMDGTPDAPVAVINLVAESIGLVIVLSLRWGHHAPSTDTFEHRGTP